MANLEGNGARFTSQADHVTEALRLLLAQGHIQSRPHAALGRAWSSDVPIHVLVGQLTPTYLHAGNFSLYPTLLEVALLQTLSSGPGSIHLLPICVFCFLKVDELRCTEL